MLRNMESSNKKIVITGVSGFIGKNLAKHLKLRGYEIIGIDIAGTGESCSTFYLGSFNDESITSIALKEAHAVFHLGAIVGVDRCQDNPDLVRQVNFTQTVLFLDRCVELGIKKLIFSSSSEVYGNSKDLPYREDTAVSPISLYAKCKRDTEIHLEVLSKSRGMQVCIPRFFNVYGPGQRSDFVVTKFINLVKTNKNIEIYGNGLQTRSHTFIDDVVNALEKMITYNETPYEIFNVGSTFEYTMNDVAKIILEFFPDSKSEVLHVEYGSNGTRDISLEIDRRVPSIQKTENKFSFKAKIDLKEGIQKMIR